MTHSKALVFTLFFLPTLSLANDLSLRGAQANQYIVVELGSSEDRTETELSQIWKGFNILSSESLGELHNEPCVWSTKFKRGKFLPKYGAHRKEIVKETFSCDLSGHSPLAGSTYSRKRSGKFFCVAGCEKNPFRFLSIET